MSFASQNQIAFALEILKLLAEKPWKRADLAAALSDRGFGGQDLSQKIARMLKKLRECGFEIRGAPNCPYELFHSNFPVILSADQQEALAMAVYFLSDMGFSAQAGSLLQMGEVSQTQLPSTVKVNFSPPVDYSQECIEQTVQALQTRFQQRRRYTIRYRSAQGNERKWDCDRSELRLHNGTLYLFAHTPDSFLANHLVERNRAFRIDRILTVDPASQTPWGILQFPTLSIRYRMSGDLGTYQPRRASEQELLRDAGDNWVEIETEEDYLFWFRQRILQYGSNVRVLSPEWIVQQIGDELAKAALNYATKELNQQG